MQNDIHLHSHLLFTIHSNKRYAVTVKNQSYIFKSLPDYGGVKTDRNISGR